MSACRRGSEPHQGREGDGSRDDDTGASPRNTHRQLAWRMTKARCRREQPGMTQAVDSTANIRGRSDSGRLRPMLA